MEIGHFAFLNHPLKGLGVTYAVHLMFMHWKACSGLPISDNWTYFVRSYG